MINTQIIRHGQFVRLFKVLILCQYLSALYQYYQAIEEPGPEIESPGEIESGPKNASGGQKIFCPCVVDFNPSNSVNASWFNPLPKEKSQLTSEYYVRARHFCPETARFLQTDPLGYVDSANLYQGFSMNPTNIIDPMGTIGMDPSTAFFSWQFFLANNKEEVNKAHQLQMQYNSGEVEGHKYSDVGDGNDLFAMATGYSLLDGKEVNFTTTEKVLTVVGIGLPVFGGAALRSFWKFLFADPSNIKKGLNAIENGVEQGKHLDNINFHPAKDPNIIHSTKTDNGLIQITKDEMNHVYGEGYDYKKVFFTENPDLKGKVVVHHGIEQQTLKRYPNLLNETEIHSIDNLRGIPLKLNSDLHLRKIRKEWNNFYRAHPNPTKDQLIQKRLEIDSKYGNLFNPKKVNE